MWIFIALPLTLILLVLMNYYLKRDFIPSYESFNQGNTAFLPSKPLYILFLLVIFIAGIVSFGAQYYYSSDYVKAAKIATLVLMLLLVAYIDYKSRIIPEKVLLAGVFLRFVFYLIEMSVDVKETLAILIADSIGIMFGCGFLLLGALISKDSIGMGDVKMYGVIGLFCGYSGTLASIVFSLFLCFIASIILLLFKKKDRKYKLPLAPFVFAGTLLAVISGSS